jgi:3-oxoacyl-[acyl-carrier protein] reductase
MKTVSFNFQGKNIVITGGAQGIGLEVAREFLDAGASVAIWDYSADALKAAEADLATFKGRVHAMQVDVSKMDSCQAAGAKLPWKIDGLVNNAGVLRDKTFAKMSEEDWNTVIATNLTGVFNVTKALFESFKPESAHKRIVNLASVVALYGNFGQTNYVASKAGVIGMTKTWAREFGKHGFTVNAIAPGFIQTRMTMGMPENVIQSMVAKIPVARMGKTADIANACLFLCSEESSYVNGTVISVDGGFVA